MCGCDVVWFDVMVCVDLCGVVWMCVCVDVDVVLCVLWVCVDVVVCD